MDKKQLVWRCRRGVRELDVLLTTFVEREYDALSEIDKQAFHDFLKTQDPVIMDWLFGKSQPDDDRLRIIVGKLQTTSQNLHST